MTNNAKGKVHKGTQRRRNFLLARREKWEKLFSKEIVELINVRYGLDSGKPVSLDEASEKTCIPKGRAIELERKVLRFTGAWRV